MARLPILFALTVSALLADVSAESLKALRPGQRLEVVQQNGGKVTGKLGVVGATSFTLEPDRGSKPSRDFQYTDVREVHTKMTRGKKWLIAGAVYLGVTTLFGVIMGA